MDGAAQAQSLSLARARASARPSHCNEAENIGKNKISKFQRPLVPRRAQSRPAFEHIFIYICEINWLRNEKNKMIELDCQPAHSATDGPQLQIFVQSILQQFIAFKMESASSSRYSLSTVIADLFFLYHIILKFFILHWTLCCFGVVRCRSLRNENPCNF